MRLFSLLVSVVAGLGDLGTGTGGAVAQSADAAVQLGPRPFYLVDALEDGALKSTLQQCTGPFEKTEFSIGASRRAAAVS